MAATVGTIVAAIREGRGIYDNLRKVIDYLVSSNLAEVAVVVSTLILVPGLGSRFVSRGQLCFQLLQRR